VGPDSRGHAHRGNALDLTDWTNHIVALDATGNTNGNVTVRIDLLTSGYGSMDNFVIAASNTPGDVTVPEPASVALVVLGLGAMALGRRRAAPARV
jgi:hypothetical protein